MLRELNLAATRGVVTIGTGLEGSVGVVNVDRAIGGDEGPDAGVVIQSVVNELAQSGGGAIELLAGTYYFRTPVFVEAGIDIRNSSRAVMHIRHSEPVGAYSFEGIKSDRSRIRGGHFVVSTFVPNQTIIRCVDAQAIYIDDVSFLHNTLLDGDRMESTPMNSIRFLRCSEKYVRSCRFLPSWGVVPIYSENGNALNVLSNQFSSGTFQGLGGVTTPPERDVTLPFDIAAPRAMHIGIHIVGDEWCVVANNRFFAIGDALGLLLTPFTYTATTIAYVSAGSHITDSANGFASILVGDVLRTTGSGAGNNAAYLVTTKVSDGDLIVERATGTITNESAGPSITIKRGTVSQQVMLIQDATTPTGTEAGHHTIVQNQIESVATRCGIEMRGINSCNIVANLIGLLGQGPAFTNDAGIKITGSNGDTSGDATAESAGIIIAANDMHNNPGGDKAAFVYLEKCQNVVVGNNSIAVQGFGEGVRVDSATARRCTIKANTFRTTNPTGSTLTAVHLLTGTVLNGIAVLNNDWQGHQTFLDNDSTGGVVKDIGNTQIDV